MQKSGHLVDSTSSNTPASKVSSKSVPKQADVDRDKKRKAAAPGKQTASNKAPPESEFLGLSDADFMKKYA